MNFSVEYAGFGDLGGVTRIVLLDMKLSSRRRAPPLTVYMLMLCIVYDKLHGKAVD